MRTFALAAFVAAALVLVPARPAAADLLEVSGRAGAWYGVMGGSVRYPATFVGPPPATGRVSTELEDDDVLPFGEIAIKILFVHVEADVWYGEFQDDTSGTGTFTFQGVTFSGSQPIHTEGNLLAVGGRVQFDLPIPLVDIGLSLGVRYVRADGKIRGNDPLTGGVVEEEGRAEVPIPQIGLSVSVELFDLVEVYGKVRGIYIEYDRYHIENIEAEIGAALNIGNHLGIGLEYRIWVLSGDDEREASGAQGQDRASVDLRLQGPMFFVRLRF